MKFLSIQILLILCSINLFSQISKDTIFLKEAVVKGDRKESGIMMTYIDSTVISSSSHSNLGELLSTRTPVFVKTYGQGGLATTSFRGTGASHTQVFWNSVGLNSSMLGHFDLSLLPVFLADEVEIFHGGASTFNNFGSIGGSIFLNQNPLFNNKFSTTFQMSYGSFSSINGMLKIHTSDKNKALDVRIYHNEAENDFSFRNNAVSSENFPVEIRKDADYRMTGIQLNYWMQTKKAGLFSCSTWLQNMDRSIPQPIVVKPLFDNENLNAKMALFSFVWQKESRMSFIKVSSGYKFDFMKYSNKLSSLVADNTTHSYSLNVNYSHKFNYNLRLNVIGISNIDNAKSMNYDKNLYRKYFSIITKCELIPTESISLLFQVGTDAIANSNPVVMPSLNLNWIFIKGINLSLFGNIAMNHHYPTFNDMYWVPGGNPYLTDEKSLGYEIGFHQQRKTDKYLSNIKVAAFTSDVDDWIVWLPDTQYRYWRPFNIRKVKVYGLETTIDIKIDISKNWQSGFSSNYAFTYTQNVKGVGSFDNSINKHLIYVPLHLSNTWLLLKYMNFQLDYGIFYTGERYTTPDNKRYLPSYTLNDIRVGYSVIKKKNRFDIHFSFNNIWDIDYHAIAWQPMPGRSYTISFKMQWH